MNAIGAPPMINAISNAGSRLRNTGECRRLAVVRHTLTSRSKWQTTGLGTVGDRRAVEISDKAITGGMARGLEKRSRERARGAS
jgi:hypothetical protein